MNNFRRLVSLAAVSFACLLLLAACNSGGGPKLRYITISPTSATISTTTTQQFTATGYYSDGSSKDLTNSVSWASSKTTVATINASGVATAVAAGTTTITAATSEAPGASASLTVIQPYTSIAVSCSPASIAPTGISDCTAIGNPGAVDITTQVTWSSSTSTVATIPASASASPAVATGVSQGTSDISATLNGVSSNNFTLTVTTVGPVSLQLTPATPSIAIGNTVTFTVVEVWSDMTTHPVSGAITWSTSAATNATVDPLTGIVLGVASGQATITAAETAALTIKGTATVTVAAGVTKFAYISNIGDQTIQWYTVTAANATPLVSQGTAPTSFPPVQTVLHPGGAFMYVLEGNSNPAVPQNEIFVYTIDASGTPADSGLPSTIAGGENANSAAVDPYGRFLYVLDSGDASTTTGSLFAFSIDPGTGALTLIGTGPITAGLDYPQGVVVDRTGSYVYVTNGGLNGTANANTLNAYQIDQSTGALSPLGVPSYPTGLTPAFATIDPSGSHIYVANNGDGSVSGYTVNKSTGALTPFSGGATTVTGSNSVLNLVVDPSGKYLYVLDGGVNAIPVGNGQVYGYLLNSDGTLPTTPITGTPQPVGGLPTGIAIDASGTLLAIDNSNDNDISLYGVGSGGALTAKSPATVAAGTNDVFITFYNAAP